jgi:predicted nucleotidyltransferase
MPRRSSSVPASDTAPLHKLRAIVLPITRAHGARNVRLFGSFARGEQRRTSDVDLLIDLPAHMSLMDLAGLKVELEEALQRKVDLLTEAGLSPYLRDRILREARPL